MKIMNLNAFSLRSLTPWYFSIWDSTQRFFFQFEISTQRTGMPMKHSMQGILTKKNELILLNYWWINSRKKWLSLTLKINAIYKLGSEWDLREGLILGLASFLKFSISHQYFLSTNDLRFILHWRFEYC